MKKAVCKISLNIIILLVSIIMQDILVYAKPMDIDPAMTQWSNDMITLGGMLLFLALFPSFLMACTCFTRIVIVFSFLRVALGTNQSPPNAVLLSIALFVSIFIMQDTILSVYNNSIKPFQEGKIEFSDAMLNMEKPVRDFMMQYTDPKTIALFANINKKKEPAEVAEIVNKPSLFVLIPSFIVSELQTAFIIGFMVFLPFIIIDLVVSSVLMAMGIMMLPPVMISLPIKLIFFVSVDGWQMIIGSLARGFNS